MQTFRESRREVLRAGGTLALGGFWGTIMSDLVSSAAREHAQNIWQRWQQLRGQQEQILAPAQIAAPVLSLQVAQHTDVGCKRSNNEDNLVTVLPDDPQLFQTRGALFVVADGMGGHLHGEMASELAVETVRKAYYQSQDEDVAISLQHAIRLANKIIYGENVLLQVDMESSRVGMGTTCIAAVLQGNTLTVANVGDSRAYVVHNGQMHQISQDHSIVAEMVRAGLITAEQARSHARRNQIYRCLGSEPEVEVDVFTETVVEGDVVMLCTDGLTGAVDETEILRIVEVYQPEASVQQLIACANEAGGPDNITAIVVHVENVPEMAELDDTAKRASLTNTTTKKYEKE
jgi:serine/threonine protein phosphatase PrpC